MATLTKWTVNDYHRMIEAGILQGRQVELLAGVVVDMSPETPIHYNTAKRSSRRLQKLFEEFMDVRFNRARYLYPMTLSPSRIVRHAPFAGKVPLPDDRHPARKTFFWLSNLPNSSLKKGYRREKRLEFYSAAGILRLTGGKILPS